MSARHVCAWALVVLLAWPALVAAQRAGREPPGAQSFRDGIAAMAAGRFGEAEVLLERAWRDGQLRNALWNLAQCQAQLGRPADAVATIGRYLDDPRTGAEDRTAAVTERARLLGLSGRLALASHPSGARVAVDGVERGTAPLELVLNPGEHAVQVSAPGFSAWSRTVSLDAGRLLAERANLQLSPGRLRLTSAGARSRVLVDGRPVRIARDGAVEMSLPGGTHVVEVSAPGMHSGRWSVSVRPAETVELPVELPAAAGTLLVDAPRGATVRLRGRIVGRTPLSPLALRPGTYRMRVEAPESEAWEGDVVVRDGASTLARVRLVPSHGLSPVAFGVTAGVGAAAAVVGGVLLLESRAARDEYATAVDEIRSDSYGNDGIQDETGRAQDAARRYDRSLLASRVLFAGAAGAALAAALLLPLTTFVRTHSSADLRVGLVALPDGGGASVQGTLP